MNESPKAVEWGDEITIPPDYPLEKLWALAQEPGVSLGYVQRQRLRAYLAGEND